MENIKEKAEEIVNSLKKDDKLMEKFKADPIQAVKDLVSYNFSNEQLENIVKLVKTALASDGAAEAVNKIKNLFGKN